MDEAFARLSAAVAGRYRIIEILGRGGMSTVYRAEDLRHGRGIALKVMRPEVSAVLGGDRFVHEIQTTASLQHPHILPLYDSGQSEGFLYYVMPLVEGESLRMRLDREKQIPVAESVKIAVQVAHALDYAHRRGVIHRDIKPANILLQDGEALVADFGIALALDAAAGARLTATGLSVGTPAYMSPEQATGERRIDKRSDIYSVGAVLYEMLCGLPPHTADTARALLARVALEEPRPIEFRCDAVPPGVAAAVMRSLSKTPTERFATAADFAQALDEQVRPKQRRFPGHVSRKRKPVMWIGGGLALAAGVLAVRSLNGPRELTVRSVSLADGQRIVHAPGNRVALSSDGSVLYYFGESEESGKGALAGQVWVRDLSDSSATPMLRIANGCCFVLSPDESRIAVLRGHRLDVFPIDGGPAVTDEFETGIGVDGLAWSSDGFIYLDGMTRSLPTETPDERSLLTVGIIRVAPGSTELEVVTRVDTARGELDHIYPVPLPDGAGILFTVATGDFADYELAVWKPGFRTHRILRKGVAGRITPTGHLVVVTGDGSLLAVPFDVDDLRITGEPVGLFSDVQLRIHAAVDLAISNDGTLVYVRGAAEDLEKEQIVWMAQDGSTAPVDASWYGVFRDLSLSPDDRRLAVTIFKHGEEHIWIKELPDGPLTRLTSDGVRNRAPHWTPDGRSVTFVSDRSGEFDLYQKKWDGSERALLLADANGDIRSGVWSGDGAWLVYSVEDQRIVARSLDGDSVVLSSDRFTRGYPAVGPDLRYLAYQSNETGIRQLYLQAFPDLSTGRWLASPGSAIAPRWSADGSTVYYQSGPRLMALPIPPSGAVDPNARRTIADLGRASRGRADTLYSYSGSPLAMDVSSDGTRVVAIRRVLPTGELVLVGNLFRHLRSAVH